MRFEHSYTVFVFTDCENKSVRDYAERTRRHIVDVLDGLESRILKMKYVQDVCFNHQSWVRLDLETSDAKVATARTEAFKAKLTRMYDKLKA